VTVAALPAVAEYVEDGVSTSFPVPFRFKAPTDLIVERLLASGVQTLSIGIDYTVSGGATDAGGTVTRKAASSGARLRIRRDTARAQTMAYPTGGRFPAMSHEEALDRQMLIAQEQDAGIADIAERALQVPPGEAAVTLPSAADRAQAVLAFDETGRGTARPIGSFPPGPPGGNVLSVGLFDFIKEIPGGISTGTNLIQSSGLSRGQLIEDPSLTDAVVAAHPRAITKTKNGRFFRRDPRELWLEQFGADPTGVQDSAPALRAAMDYIIRCGRSEDGAAFTRNGPILRIGIGVFRLDSLVNWRVGNRIIGSSSNHEIGRYGTVFRVYGRGGIWFDRADTESGIPISPAKTGANGFSLEDVSFEYAGPPVDDSYGATFGVVSSCQGTYKNITATGFPGLGAAFLATSGATSEAGEASGCVVDGMTALANFIGFRAAGSDTSNLVMRGSLNFGFNRAAGYDLSQLLSAHVANVAHCKFNGNANTVHYAGMIYQGAWDASQDALANTIPGQNNRIWVPWMAGGASSAGRGTWAAGGRYWPSGAFFSTNPNARTKIESPYTEGGTAPPQVMAPSHIDGGQTQQLSQNSTALWVTYEQGGMRASGGFDAPGLSINGKSIVAAAQSSPTGATATKVPTAAGSTPTKAEFDALDVSHSALIDDVQALRAVVSGLITKLRAAGTLAQ